MFSLPQLALAFAPGLLWLVVLRRKDAAQPEPRLVVAGAFLLGCAAAQAIGWARPRIEHWIAADLDLDGVLTDAFLATAAPEELAKLAAILLGAYWARAWDEPLDGVIYGAAVGLGFASLENAYYLVESGSAGTVLARAFTANLAHVAFSACAGFALGLAKLSRARWGSRAAIAAGGVVVAIVLHGAYDALLLHGEQSGVLALVGLLPIYLALLGAKIRWAKSRSRSALEARAARA